jgi:hypothetical protein
MIKQLEIVGGPHCGQSAPYTSYMTTIKLVWPKPRGSNYDGCNVYYYRVDRKAGRWIFTGTVRKVERVY